MAKYILDIETDGLLAKLTKVHCLVLRDADTGEVYSYADQPGYPSIVDGLVRAYEADKLIMHNGIKFDLVALKKVYPYLEPAPECEICDTLVMSRVLWPELEPVDHQKFSHIEPKYMGRHSLAAWGERLGVAKIHFKEETKKNKEVVDVWANWTPEMQTYCEQDTEVTLKLYRYLSCQPLDPRCYELEHKFAEIMTKQEQFGFPFDERAAYALVNTLKVRRDEIDEQLQKVFPPIIEERISTKTGKQLKSKVTVFNPASRQQTADRLREIYPEIVFDTTDKGNPQVDDDVLEVLGEKYPEAKLLAEYQMLNKRIGQIAEGKEAWLKHVTTYGDGRIHGEVNTNACVSGRCSHCIEENQLVTTPAGQVKIKDIQVGDYVYSYDKDFKLRLNKISEVIDQGIQECYVVNWKTNINGKSGSIVCTENHKLLTKTDGYRRVKDIKKGDKICHLTVSIADGRQVLHMVGRNKKRQCTFIKEELYGKTGKEWHIHHIDNNKLNDSLDNLVVLKAEEHARIHHTSEQNSGYISKTKFQLLRMLAKSKARPTYVPMDFGTFKKKCEENNIDISKVVARYSKVTGKYITKRMVYAMLEQSWNPYKAGKEFKIDGRKSRIDALLDSHGIIENHWIQSVEYLGPRQTYDLNVEHDHNFICQELCVSNSHPNMAQIPSVGHPYGAECRALFYAPDGWVLVGADASGLELRALGAMLAYFDGGEYAKLVSTEGFDIHTYNAKLFGIYNGEGDITKATRDLSKRLIYALLYGAGAKKVGSVIDITASESKQYELGKELIDTFYRNLPAIKKLKDEIEKRINARSYLTGIDGRHLQIRSKHSALNQLLQSTGAITVKKATVILYNDLLSNGLKWGEDFGFVAHVHDEVQALVKPQHAELYKELAIDSFRKSGEYFNLRCPMTGEARTGKNWMETH